MRLVYILQIIIRIFWNMCICVHQIKNYIDDLLRTYYFNVWGKKAKKLVSAIFV